MDITKNRKGETNNDKNNSFNKILKLQSTLQEEVALRDIFYEDKDSLLKKIENNCIEYYKMRISIQEIYDNKSQPDPSKKKIKYIFADKPQTEIPQYYDHLSNLMYYFHDNNEMTLKLIENCPKESYSQLANFICNYFYVNIFSSTFLNENLLTLIYLLLEKEIDKITLKNENEISNTFLDNKNSFVSHLLRCLSRKDEVKTFLENILKKILTRTVGFLNNHKDNMFLGFDIKKIVLFLFNRNYQIRQTDKKIKSFLNLFTMEIKKSKLNLMKKKNKDNDDFVAMSKNPYDELNKPNLENNFYVQATKETFDNLLLGNEENINSDDDDDDSSEGEDENAQKKKVQIAGGLSNKKTKAKDDFEEYLVNNGFYFRFNEFLEEEKLKKDEGKNIDIFNELYMKELNKECFLELLDKEDDKDMEEYLLKHLKTIQDNEKGNVFTNTKLINEIIHMGISSNEVEEATLIYKYHFECIKSLIDELFTSLIQNKENVPYMIRAICTIISKLFSAKFQNASVSNSLKVKIVSEFLFNNLIVPILDNPQFNGTLMFDLTKEKDRNLKIKTTIKILQKLLNGELYNSTINDEYLYTIFNPYFIEIMPFIFEFFREVSNSKLPVNIEKLLEIKKSPNNRENERDIQFNYLKIHYEERLEHQSMCLTFKDFLIIYNIIKSNEEAILGDKSGLVYKTYKKITYHEDNLKSKVENDKKNFKKTFIYLSKLNFDEELSKKMNSKKEQKISFQMDDTLASTDNAQFTLTRVKYSINTIIKNLNVLSRTNFLANQTDSTEDFIKGLNKMIQLEGFSEMLKEKKVPLEWFGLYLQSNIENIPPNYRENNYALLYNELIEESKQNLLNIQNDDSLNTIYSKIINSEKMIDIGLNNLKRIINNEKKFEIIDFILNSNVPVLMDIYYAQNGQLTGIYFREDTNSKGKNEPDKKPTETKKCRDINDFCTNFPNIDSDDIFTLEEEIELKDSLDNYFGIVHNYMEKEEIFSEYNEEEKKNIKKKIENFIHEQIYDKIYYKTTVQADNNIYKKIIELSWVKPYMLDESLKYVDENMIQLMVNFISNMNNGNSPINKLREFEKIYLIINNIITLYGYDKSMNINLLVYIFIKGRPTGLYSTMRYIDIYLSDEIKKEKSYLITKIKDVISKIVMFSGKDVVGISEKEYNKKCANATK